MKNLTTPGRLLFGSAITSFGIQHLIYAATGAGLGPPWTPVNHILAYAVGVLLLASGLCLATAIQVQCAGFAVALTMLIRIALCYVPKLVATPRDPGPWTSSFELLAIGGTSLVLLALFTGTTFGRSSKQPNLWSHLGRILFGGSLVVFGVQHLMYGAFVATLIPVWIPAHLFWAYFVGLAFLAAALAIVTGRMAALAATLLGIMFFLWVVTLHAPRVALALHNGNEWTSLLMALAMSGGSFVIAGATADSK
jgi:uncharacterized membrane protein YphA (DoxX/SURF4 family)